MSMPRRPSLMGALLWIVMGITFLLYNFKTGPDLVWIYKRYWPLLLILLGLGKIIDFFFQKNTIGVRFGELVGLVLAFTIGCLATRAYGIDGIRLIQNLPKEIAAIFHQPVFTYTEESIYPLGFHGPIRIENSYGSVSVFPGADNEIRVRLKKVINGEESQTKTMAGKIHVETDTEGSKPDSVFVIRTNRYTLNSRGERFRTDMEILVPKNSQLQIKNMFGEIRIAHINGNLVLSTSHQSIDVQDCRGKFDISARYSQTRLSNLTGDVSITSESSPIEVYDVDGKLSVKSNHGFLTIERVTKPVVIDGRGTVIRAQNLKDSLKLTTDHQEVKISDIDSDVTLKTQYASLSLNNIKGNVYIDSNTDTVNAEDLIGGLTVVARGSWIGVNHIQGPLDVRTSLKDVLLNDFAESCIVHNEYGNISVNAQNLGKGDITLRNQTGGIDLYLPEDAAFEINAVARNGRVDSDHEKLQSFQNQTGNGVLRFKLKDGGPKIMLETENNNIRIFNALKNHYHQMPQPKRPKPPASPAFNRFAYQKF